MTTTDYQRGRMYLSWRIWLIYALLFAIAIPWYWPPEDATRWFGMPVWVVVAVVTSAVISGFTAWLLRRPWPDRPEAKPDKADP